MSEPNEQTIIQIKIPLADENLREELNFFKELRLFLREYGKPLEEIDFIIANIEADLEQFSQIRGIVLDEEAIMNQLEKHPYFKNPGSYPIRLLTLLKYLKAKGFNMQYTGIDLYIDRIVQKLEGVKKVGKGLYQKTR